MKRILKNISLAILISFFISCENEKELYQIPPWLGGSIIETLEEEGNYTTFLELAEKAGYLEVIEKNLYTVFAADDDAFKSYFDSRGISSVADLSEEECVSLITLNLINTPRSRQQLIYIYTNNAWQDSTSEYLSLFFRWPTSSEYPIQKEVVKYNIDYKGTELKIKGLSKYVPLFSEDFFGDYGGDPKGSDYNYFYPNTEWSGLQWFNAAIQNNEARCSNGFIYYIDQVVPVTPSIEEYLRNNQNKYGVFYDIIQRFAIYNQYAETEEEAIDPPYTKSYSDIANIALEDGPQAGAYIRRNIFTAFIPPDDVLNEYLNNTILSKYSSIDSVPKVTLIYLINGHIASNLLLPSKMQKEFFNPYGEKMDFDPYQDVTEVKMLSNGAFFEIKEIMEPLAFQAVPGPLFYNDNYTTFLYALNSAKMISTISMADVPVTVFAPTNDKLMEYGVRYDKYEKILQKRDVFGIWEEMEVEEIKNLVNDHILFDQLDDLSGEEFLIMNSGTGVYLNNNTLVAGGNREDGDEVKLKEAINSNLNGILYLMDNAVKAPEEDYARFIANNSDFSELFSLLNQAGLVDTVEDADTKLKYPRIKFLAQYKYWTGFLPDNDAITQARANNLIPTDETELQLFLRYHFVSDEVISDLYSVSDNYVTGSYDTTGEDLELNIQVQPKQMTVTDGSGQQVQIDHATANDFVRDGIVHRISTVLVPNL